MEEPKEDSIPCSHAEGACLRCEPAHWKVESDRSSGSPLRPLLQRPFQAIFLVSVSASLFTQWVQEIYFQDIKQWRAFAVQAPFPCCTGTNHPTPNP